MVRVRLHGVLAQECRRCLAPVKVEVEQDVDLVFVSAEESGDLEEEGVRPLPAGSGDLELAGPVREEVILTQSLFVLCREGCKGLCPQCGVNLNEDRCQCSTEELDPRWDALRALNEERE